MKDTFVDLLKSSILVQSTVTLILIAAYTYMVVAERTIPDNFINVTLLIVGFWFGSKVGYTQGQGAAHVRREADLKGGE